MEGVLDYYLEKHNISNSTKTFFNGNKLTRVMEKYSKNQEKTCTLTQKQDLNKVPDKIKNSLNSSQNKNCKFDSEWLS